jgi:hypothetical protein
MADLVAARKRREILKKATSTPSSNKLLSKIVVAVAQQNTGVAQYLGTEFLDDASIFFPAGDNDTPTVDHRSLPRPPRREYRHEMIEERINHNYLCPYPLFDGREFDTMFRISRSRFQRIMEDFGAKCWRSFLFE